MALLHGTELNIAPDGSVDWDEDFLSGFDLCVASVQSENPDTKHLNLPRGQRWAYLSDGHQLPP
jgi:histidinol phosphatase-like PHP family hydrolase